jgi:hypothetical protein
MLADVAATCPEGAQSASQYVLRCYCLRCYSAGNHITAVRPQVGGRLFDVYMHLLVKTFRSGALFSIGQHR